MNTRKICIESVQAQRRPIPPRRLHRLNTKNCRTFLQRRPCHENKRRFCKKKKTSEDRLSPYRIPYPCWPNLPKPSPRAEEQLAQTAGSGKFSGPARRRNGLLNKIGRGNPARGMPRGMKPRIVALLQCHVSLRATLTPSSFLCVIGMAHSLAIFARARARVRSLLLSFHHFCISTQTVTNARLARPSSDRQSSKELFTHTTTDS